MPRGGVRPGAGRKSKGNHLNPRAIADLRQKIKAGSIIKRLTDFIDGRADMNGPAVTAALGLLKKIVPDLSAVELSGEVDGRVTVNIVRYADDQPAE